MSNARAKSSSSTEMVMRPSLSTVRSAAMPWRCKTATISFACRSSRLP